MIKQEERRLNFQISLNDPYCFPSILYKKDIQLIQLCSVIPIIHSLYGEISLWWWHYKVTFKEYIKKRSCFWKQFCHLGPKEIFQKSLKASELELDTEYNLFRTQFPFMWFLTLNLQVILNYSFLVKPAHKVIRLRRFTKSSWKNIIDKDLRLLCCNWSHKFFLNIYLYISVPETSYSVRVFLFAKYKFNWN